VNNRRKLIVALGAGALAMPFASFAQQQGKVWRVGFLYLGSRQSALDTGRSGAFLQGMRELGYVEGKNLAIEWRFADGTVERLPSLAAELVRLNVDVIVAAASQAIRAAQQATTTIPIVMATTGDPVASGFVKSLARPEGNITGLTNMSGDLSSKHLEMLLSMVPKLSRVAVLLNPTSSTARIILPGIQTAAQRSNVKIVPLEARTAQEIENAFSRMAQEKAGAVIVANEAFFIVQRRQLAGLATKYRIPSMFATGEYVEAGGLMSYGVIVVDDYRRAAHYVDKILKGARPANLPVEQPTKFELVVNMKTAKALGLTIPQSLLIMAEKVIE
jgi:putative ABC transport system substrate-binding protein